MAASAARPIYKIKNGPRERSVFLVSEKIVLSADVVSRDFIFFLIVLFFIGGEQTA